jgi:hypothetical protein
MTTMTTMTESPKTTSPEAVATTSDEIHLHRRTVDKVLIAIGTLIAVVFAVAGGLLMWGSNFAEDYVDDELSSQNVVFPSADELREEGRDDLAGYGGETVNTGDEAEAYAGFIAGHMEGIADGQTYSQIDDRGAAEAVVAAEEAGASPEEIAELQATADELRTQRDSLFRGETLRGLLLTSYAWATVGEIAGIAAWAAFAAAVVMAGLVIAGVVHMRRSYR